MNKRQAKKKYKKEHGYNSPSKRQVININSAIPVVIQGITAAFKEFLKVWEDTVNRIQTMSKEELESYMDKLTPDQRAIVLRIRNRSK